MFIDIYIRGLKISIIKEQILRVDFILILLYNYYLSATLK